MHRQSSHYYVLFSLLFVLCILCLEMNQNIKTYLCSYCKYQTRDEENLLTHYSISHEFSKKISITCTERGCQSFFKSIRCFRRHKRQYHKLSNLQDIHEYLDDEDNPLDNSSDESDNENAEFDCTKAVATSILNLREHKKVPKQICQNFIDLTNALLVSQQNSLVYQIKRKMLDENIPENTVKKVCSNILKDVDDIQSSISSFGKRDALDNYIERNMNYVSPVTYFLGPMDSDSMQYVPILETLRLLLMKNDVFAQVTNPHISLDGKIRDICDGQYFKTHPFWQSDNTLLQIILYFDEFTAISQMGCHASRYKFAGFYYQLGNINECARSQTNLIQLAAQAKANSLK